MSVVSDSSTDFSFHYIRLIPISRQDSRQTSQLILALYFISVRIFRYTYLISPHPLLNLKLNIHKFLRVKELGYGDIQSAAEFDNGENARVFGGTVDDVHQCSQWNRCAAGQGVKGHFTVFAVETDSVCQ